MTINPGMSPISFSAEIANYNNAGAGDLFESSNLDSADKSALMTLWDSGDTSQSATDQAALHELAGSTDYIAKEIGSMYQGNNYSSETIRDGLFAMDHTTGLTDSETNEKNGLAGAVDFTNLDSQVTAPEMDGLFSWLSQDILGPDKGDSVGGAGG